MTSQRVKQQNGTQSARRFKHHRNVVLLGILVAFVVVLLALGAILGASRSNTSPGQYFPSQGHHHFNPREDMQFAYNSNPPTSGPHLEKFPTAFVVDTPLPPYISVHVLEHGNVIINYNRFANPESIIKLRKIVDKYDSQFSNLLVPLTPGADVGEQLEAVFVVYLFPYPDMPHKIALTAWTRLDAFDEFNEQRIIRFIEAYLGNRQNVSQ